MVGLVGDFVVLFIQSGKVEKRLAVTFTTLIAIGVAVEHFADAKRFAPRSLSASQQKTLVTKLSKFAKQKVVRLTYEDDQEASELATQIINCA